MTKKEMMEYRFIGKKIIERQIENYPVQNDELKKQIELNIEKFERYANLMNMNQLKSEMRGNYKKLVNVVKTIKLITEKQEVVISMLPNI